MSGARVRRRRSEGETRESEVAAEMARHAMTAAAARKAPMREAMTSLRMRLLTVTVSGVAGVKRR
jgi:hypothetical protein